MKEIGGYIELDTYTGTMLYDDAVKLNCGRNALDYLIKTKNIQVLWLPKFICISFNKVLERNHVTVKRYEVGIDFKPVNILRKEGEWLLIVNYYGQFSNAYLEAFGENVIVDNSMAYFQEPPTGVDTLYSCRKFFGVPDGAILFTDKFLEELPQDTSYQRMQYLLGRFEVDAGTFYQEYDVNNHAFSNEPLMRMSKLTENLLHGIDYEKAKSTRTENFEILHNAFQAVNQLNITVPTGAYMYPLYLENAESIRKELLKEKIYIPTLWRTVFQFYDKEDLACLMSRNILPLPVDQRYTGEDMEQIIHAVKKEL